MVQTMHPRDVILVPKLSLMWADQLKKLTAVPSIYKEVHELLYLNQQVLCKKKIAWSLVM